MPTRARRHSRSIRCWSSSRSRSGPALIALLLAIGSPTVAFGAAFVFSAIAVPTFLASPALRYWRHEPHAERHLLGPLTEPRLLAVFATTFLLTCSLGMLEIGYPGFAARVGESAAGGRAAGGELAGQRDWRLDLRRPALRVAAGAAVASRARPRGRADRHPRVHRICRSARDRRVRQRASCIAPTLTMVTLLVSSYAPSRYATEAFTWSATCIISGIGAGNALGGVLLEAVRARGRVRELRGRRGTRDGVCARAAACGAARAPLASPHSTAADARRGRKIAVSNEEPEDGDPDQHALRCSQDGPARPMSCTLQTAPCRRPGRTRC